MESIEERLYLTTLGTVKELGFVLLDVDEVIEHGRRVLRFYIDGPGGVSLDDCASVSVELGYVLDAEPELDGGYVLEVSSPGLDHRLRKLREYEYFAGRTARVVLRNPLEGANVVTGEIAGADESGVRVVPEGGEELSIPLGDIARARLVP